VSSLSSAPRSVIWIATARCFLRCVHCYAAQYSGEDEMSTESAKRMIDEAADLGARHLHITGGDPVTRSDLTQLLRHAYDAGLEVSVFTSLIHVPRDLVETIERIDATLYTSMDGGDRETFERVRGRGTWDRFVENLRRVAREGIEIHVNCSITSLNWDRVAYAIERALELGASSTSVIPAMKCGRAVETRSFIDRERLVKALRMVDERARDLGVVVHAWCIPFVPALGLRNVVGYPCRTGSVEVVDITPGGNIVVCDVMDTRISNVVREGFRAAWEKYVSHDLVKKAITVPRECRGCPFVEQCRGGCFARAFLEYGDVSRRDPLCPRGSAIP